MNRIKQPDAGSSSLSTPSVLKSAVGGVLLSLAAGFHGKTEAAALDTPTFDAPTLIAGADTSNDELSPGVNQSTGDIAFAVHSGSNYNLTFLAAGSSTASTASGVTDSWSPQFLDDDNMYIFSGGRNDVYQATTTDTWGSASTALVYSSADYQISGDVSLDPNADPAALNTGEFLKTVDTGPSTDITDLFDETYVVADGSGDQKNPAFASNNRLLYKDNGYAYFLDLNGVLDPIAAPDLDDCDTWAYDTLNDDVICSKSGDLYRYNETTYASTTVDADGDGVSSDTDCDDSNASTYPGAAETCNSVDDDCDTAIDEAGAVGEVTSYEDADGDGVGNSAVSVTDCDVPAGYVSTGGDYDDNDATVQSEPTAEVCDTESADGSFEEGDTICAPDAEGEVYGGVVEYSSATDVVTMADEGDWLEFVGSLDLDSSSYEDRYVFTPSTDFSGGFALGIDAGAMEAALDARVAPTPPPSADGTTPFLTIRVDGGSGTLFDKVEGTTEQLVPSETPYVLEGTPDETDTDTDTDTDSDTDSGTDSGSDTNTDSGTDTDSGNINNPDDTGRPDSHREDTGEQSGGGCNCSASTSLPNGSLVAAGIALGVSLTRRKRERK